MKLLWFTDTHYDFFGGKRVKRFFEKIEKIKPDGIIHSGDIANGKLVKGVLELYKKTVSSPLYFVLGNHDFYYSSFGKVRKSLKEFLKDSEKIFWLTESEPIKLTDNIVIVGDDGWADARFGDPENSNLRLNDFIAIEEIAETPPKERFKLYRRLGDESAERLNSKLEKATLISDNIIVVTHPSPFKETTFYGSVQSDENGLPWFSSKVIGEVILKYADKYKNKKFLVLCGHTHERVEKIIRDNLKVKVGGAEYGKLEIQEIFELSEEIF